MWFWMDGMSYKCENKEIHCKQNIEEMDLQTYIDNAMKVRRADSLAKSDQLTLGKMILKLDPIVQKQKERIDEGKPEAEVRYDFEYLFPTSIDSWRGSYAELALNFIDSQRGANPIEPMKVSEFNQMLKDTIGKTFTGYKGGEFLMSQHTPVWVANYGNSGNTAVIDIVDDGYQVIIITGYREF